METDNGVTELLDLTDEDCRDFAECLVQSASGLRAMADGFEVSTMVVGARCDPQAVAELARGMKLLRQTADFLHDVASNTRELGPTILREIVASQRRNEIRVVDEGTEGKVPHRVVTPAVWRHLAMLAQAVLGEKMPAQERRALERVACYSSRRGQPIKRRRGQAAGKVGGLRVVR